MIADMHRHRPLIVGGVSVEPGTRTETELRPAQLPSGGWMEMPVVAVRGRRPGPTLWLSGALHGDEVCGVEIIRQVLGRLDPQTMRGTVLAVPVVNVPGFANGDRYMPDRRDLNRCFPGSKRGSLASRFAYAFMTEIVEKCDVGIDLHTGSDHRRNAPHIRADLADPATRELATVFGAPYALDAHLRDGSLREAGRRTGATVLLYEAGEAWRFDSHAIEVGVRGIRRVFGHLGITRGRRRTRTRPVTYLSDASWVRSPQSGVARLEADLGEWVEATQVLGVVSDAIGSTERKVKARKAGVVIGRNESPVVHRGDALLHVATPAAPEAFT